MIIRQFVFGQIQTNCYLVVCDKTRQALVIDPEITKPAEKKVFFDEIARLGADLRYVVNTHHHCDHVSGNGMLQSITGAEILIHELDAWVLPAPWEWWSKMVHIDPQRPCPACGQACPYLEIHEDQGKAILGCRTCGFRFEILASPPADRQLRHGDGILLGEIEFVVIHTPGHSAGGMCLYAQKEKVLFSGDTLFKDTVGRTDILDSSRDDIERSVRELAKLPDDTVVYPGHGETTTIGEEKRNNPYLQ